MNINLARELYAHKNLKAVNGTFTIGDVAVAGDPLCESSARAFRRGRKGPAKISTAALLYDVMRGGRIGIYASKDSYDKVSYVVLDGVGYLFKDGEVKCTGKPVHHSTLAIPFVARYIASNGAFKAAFIKVCEGITAVSVELQPMFQFCDYFYYGYAVANKEVEMDETLSEEEVKALFRNDIFERVSFGKPDLDGCFAPSKFESASKTTAKEEKKTSPSTISLIERAKKGEFIIPHSWDDQKDSVIPLSFLDSFIPFPEWEEALVAITKAVEKKAPINGEFFGKPGTGKTVAMMALSAATGLPYYPVIFSKHTEEDVLEGKTRIVDGHPTFVETDIPKYWDKGGLFDLEEINAADPGVLVAFNMALEAPGIVERNGYEKVYRSPLSFVFACMNTGIVGTSPLPPALSNRFARKWRIKDPSEGIFLGILKKKTEAEESVIRWVYEAYTKVYNWLTSPEVGEDDLINLLSIRSCIGAIENIRDGQSPKRAVVNAIVNPIAETDLTLGDQLESEVIDDLRDL